MKGHSRPERRSATRAVVGWSDPAFARIGAIAHVVAGLVFAENRQASAEAGIRRAMAALRIADPVALGDAFESPGPVRDAVLAELTIGESYFFRDSNQFEIVRGIVLERRGDPQRSGAMRMWSAGCASGEEPYSLAILLRELDWEGTSRVVGTDVSIPRLAAARRGSYTRWALRGVSSERVERWFTRSGTQFALRPEVRDAVEFTPLNLVDDAFPVGQYDLVLCRNVMIYFDMDTVARIAVKLLESLAPGGYLILGASDPMIGQLVQCAVIQTEAGLMYRRSGEQPFVKPPITRPISPATPADSDTTFLAGEPRMPTLLDEIGVELTTPSGSWKREVWVPKSETPSPPAGDILLAHTAYERSDYALAASVAERYLASRPPEETTPADWVVWVRALANQGSHTVAGELGSRALAAHPLSPELHYLYATLLAHAGWFHDSALAARRAIYLDRRFVMGYFALGDALARAGKSSEAARSFSNALSVLASLAENSVVAASDGVPAKRLRQIATLRLAALAGGPAT